MPDSVTFGDEQSELPQPELLPNDTRSQAVPVEPPADAILDAPELDAPFDAPEPSNLPDDRTQLDRQLDDVDYVTPDVPPQPKLTPAATSDGNVSLRFTPSAQGRRTPPRPVSNPSRSARLRKKTSVPASSASATIQWRD
jgi:hypothetical protein